MGEVIFTIAGILIFGYSLCWLNNKFNNQSGQKLKLKNDILKLLPQVPCRACGYENCEEFTNVLINEEISPALCTAGEISKIEQIAKLLKREVQLTDKKIAAVLCQGKSDIVQYNFKYQGIATCKAAHELNGGGRSCLYGCLGYGDCVEACLFEAISLEDDLPKIKSEKCVGCGMCAAVCPRQVIKMIPAKSKRVVYCLSEDDGPTSKEYCQKACIGCQICVSTCPFGAITMESENLAKINYELCNNCGLCEPACPTGAITVNN